MGLMLYGAYTDPLWDGARIDYQAPVGKLSDL
jgi:hypothetical protein